VGYSLLRRTYISWGDLCNHISYVSIYATQEFITNHMSPWNTLCQISIDVMVLFINNISGDCRCDQYRWNQYGYILLPASDYKVKKYYFDIVKSDNSHCNKFQRFAFHLLSNSSLVLIQYIGSELEAEDHPHGNSASSSIPYTWTCPSVIEQIKDMI